MRLWPKKKPLAAARGAVSEPAATSSPSVVAQGPEEPDLDYLQRLAAAHLPADISKRWLDLLLPAIRLKPAGDGEPVLARLGGLPRVPAGFTWPMWEGHGPLAFVGEVDLTALARSGLEQGSQLPSSGRLLAFYFDGSFDNFEGLVGTWDKESLAGARLVHVEDGLDCIDQSTPQGVLEFRPQVLTGRLVMTFPNWEHPALQREFDRSDEPPVDWMKHPVNAAPFVEALWSFQGNEPRHQIGGWADPDQGPVEFEVAQAALTAEFAYGDSIHTSEALRWSLLLQIDSDDASAMMWGDMGKLYWLRRTDRTGTSPLGDVSFTWQCG